MDKSCRNCARNKEKRDYVYIDPCIICDGRRYFEPAGEPVKTEVFYDEDTESENKTTNIHDYIVKTLTGVAEALELIVFEYGRSDQDDMFRFVIYSPQHIQAIECIVGKQIEEPELVLGRFIYKIIDKWFNPERASDLYIKYDDVFEKVISLSKEYGNLSKAMDDREDAAWLEDELMSICVRGELVLRE